MMYQGGKSRIAKRVAAAILSETDRRGTLVEPFMGGGAMTTALCPHFERTLTFDVMPDVAELWRAAQDPAWQPPQSCDVDTYEALRSAPPSAERALIGFGCSFAGKFFAGHAPSADRSGERDFLGAATRSALKQGAVMAANNVTVTCSPYDEIAVPADAVVYCDPPYEGTISYRGAPTWDAAAFWCRAAEWGDAGAHVFVSEGAGATVPVGWSEVWSSMSAGSPALPGQRKQRRERLFVYDGADWR